MVVSSEGVDGDWVARRIASDSADSAEPHSSGTAVLRYHHASGRSSNWEADEGDDGSDSAPDQRKSQIVDRLNLPLQSRGMRVSIRPLTHSHVPMAHGGYATT